MDKKTATNNTERASMISGTADRDRGGGLIGGGFGDGGRGGHVRDANLWLETRIACSTLRWGVFFGLRRPLGLGFQWCGRCAP